MAIDASTLEGIEECDKKFAEHFANFSQSVFAKAGLSPRLSVQRLAEAHGAWKHDLHRVETHEHNLNNGLDHYKRAGHLAFWLRRFCPIVEAEDQLGDKSATVTHDQWRALLHSYANEYTAFMIGFNFVRFYEQMRSDSYDRPRPERLKITNEYIETVCHFLKYKSASPHAITIIYKSMFLGD